MTANETIDEALTALQGLAPVYSAYGYDRLDNHCPMMVEAMVTLGRPDAVMPWVEEAVRDHPLAPPPVQPIGDAWREALGEGDRFGDWQMLFGDELEQHDWSVVVGKWVPRFLTGMASAGAHGVIRLAHAVRNLSGGDTEIRIGEIADGLANWAAHYYELGGAPRRAGSLRPSEAIELVDFAPSAPGTTGSRFRDLERFSAFDGVGNLVEMDEDSDAFLNDLIATFAKAYIASMGINPEGSTGLVHAVTVPAAVQLLLPYLRAEDRVLACLNAWHTSAAVYATYGSATRGVHLEEYALDWDDLTDRAVTLGNAHAVKFVEACKRASQTQGEVVFPAAAKRAVEIYEAATPVDP